MSHYVSSILKEYKKYEDDENHKDYHKGRDLWNSLYTADGIKSNWLDTLTNWLKKLAIAAKIPKGHFRECWIKDNLDDAYPGQDIGILHDIHQMFEPDAE